MWVEAKIVWAFEALLGHSYSKKKKRNKLIIKMINKTIYEIDFQLNHFLCSESVIRCSNKAIASTFTVNDSRVAIDEQSSYL